MKLTYLLWLEKERSHGYGFTMFFSLSASDTHWSGLLQCLEKLVDKTHYLKQYIINEMNWSHKCRFLAGHPVVCDRYFHHRVHSFFKYILHTPYSPFRDLEKSFYRVEAQHRGSPHIHALAWIKGLPNFVYSQIIMYVCMYVYNIQDWEIHLYRTNIHFRNPKKINID